MSWWWEDDEVEVFDFGQQRLYDVVCEFAFERSWRCDAYVYGSVDSRVDVEEPVAAGAEGAVHACGWFEVAERYGCLVDGGPDEDARAGFECVDVGGEDDRRVLAVDVCRLEGDVLVGGERVSCCRVVGGGFEGERVGGCRVHDSEEDAFAVECRVGDEAYSIGADCLRWSDDGDG